MTKRWTILYPNESRIKVLNDVEFKQMLDYEVIILESKKIKLNLFGQQKEIWIDGVIDSEKLNERWKHKYYG